jgi:hypothetical protein
MDQTVWKEYNTKYGASAPDVAGHIGQKHERKGMWERQAKKEKKNG